MHTIFEWDDEKERKNRKKHKMGFSMARRVFADPHAILEPHFENGEMRWKALGLAAEHLLLVVIHTAKDEENGSEIIRIISARKAEPHERRYYEQNH